MEAVLLNVQHSEQQSLALRTQVGKTPVHCVKPATHAYRPHHAYLLETPGTTIHYLLETPGTTMHYLLETPV